MIQCDSFRPQADDESCTFGLVFFGVPQFDSPARYLNQQIRTNATLGGGFKDFLFFLVFGMAQLGQGDSDG